MSPEQVEPVCLLGGGDIERGQTVRTLIARLGIDTHLAHTGSEVLAAARERPPTLVVLELKLRDPSAYEVCRALREEFGEGLPIAFLSTPRAPAHDEVAALLLGADDYFVEPIDEELFVTRLRRLLARAPARTRRSSLLTKREREVLLHLVEGRRTNELAEMLFITPKTAATHIDHILSKLGAHSRAEAVALAVRGQLLG